MPKMKSYRTVRIPGDSQESKNVIMTYGGLYPHQSHDHEAEGRGSERDHGRVAPGGWRDKSENADPPEQASRLIIEWTADL